jgi:pimeloyl-ACP methyl ester carboxylesterase
MNQHNARIGRRAFLARMGAGIAAGAGGIAVARDAAARSTQATPHAHDDAISHRQVETNGIRMHIAEAGEGPLVIMVHGFPELWYSWRHQLPALAAAGYHAVAPDMRGVGDTDAPEEVESYSLRNQVADILGLMDALGEERAVLVGHDTGGGATWAATELHPDRIAAHITLGIGYAQRTPEPPTEMIRQFAPGKFNYAIYFQEPGVAEAEFEADVRRTMRLFMYGISGDAPPDLLMHLFTEKPDTAGALDGVPEPEAPLDWLTEAYLDVYAAAYERTGFTGALNVYRNFDHDWEDLPEVGTLGVHQPVLFAGGRRDPAVYFTQDWIDPMVEAVPKLDRLVLLPRCGHWIQQERPDDLNAEMIDFLRRDSGL